MTRPERRTYDQSARLTQRVDGTGVNTFTYNTRDQMATMVDAVTGASRAYNYNVAAPNLFGDLRRRGAGGELYSGHEHGLPECGL